MEKIRVYIDVDRVVYYDYCAGYYKDVELTYQNDDYLVLREKNYNFMLERKDLYITEAEIGGGLCNKERVAAFDWNNAWQVVHHTDMVGNDKMYHAWYILHPSMCRDKLMIEYARDLSCACSTDMDDDVSDPLLLLMRADIIRCVMQQ